MRKKKSAPFSIGHVDADTILEMNEPYTPSANDFAPADAAEKESFITRAKSTSYWKDAWRRLRKNTVAMIALGVIIFLVLFAFVGPLLTPYDYSTQMRNEENWPPFWRDADPIVQQKADEAGIKIDKSKHILGTDSLGRDNLTRLMYGTRISITIGLAASLIVLIIGSLIGAISGYLGGAADVVIMRITEIIYSVPDVLVVLLLSTGLKESISAYISNHPGSFSRRPSAFTWRSNHASASISFGRNAATTAGSPPRCTNSSSSRKSQRFQFGMKQACSMRSTGQTAGTSPRYGSGAP